MSHAEIKRAKTLIGKMDRRDIAEMLGVSLSNLTRAFRGQRLAFHNYCVANPKLVREVNLYFAKHSQEETAKHFGLSRKQVDHIIYRYRLISRKQIQWTEPQIVEAARMAGLLSLRAQAKFFKRPNAFEGSIKSLWIKKFKSSSVTSIHGMSHWIAKELCNHKAKYIRPFGNDRHNVPVKFRRVILWVDMEKCLKREVPVFLRDAIATMAEFQRWIFDSKDPKRKIIKMINEREGLGAA